MRMRSWAVRPSRAMQNTQPARAPSTVAIQARSRSGAAALVRWKSATMVATSASKSPSQPYSSA